MKKARKSLPRTMLLATSAFATPGPASCRPSGAIHTASSNSTTRNTTRNAQSKDWRDWPYYAADAAVFPPDGYYRILGRVDDVINVAGHRLGTKELESACLTVPEIAGAAVVPIVDEVKGRIPEIYISLKPGVLPKKQIIEKVTATIETMIGKIARPKRIH